MTLYDWTQRRDTERDLAADAAAWDANEKMHTAAQPETPDESAPRLVLAEGAAWDRANALRAAGFKDEADAVLNAFYDSLSE